MFDDFYLPERPSFVTDRKDLLYGNEKEKQLIPELSNMAMRLRSNGGPKQSERMIFDKKRTLDRVVKYSYQRAEVEEVPFKKIPKDKFPPTEELELPQPVRHLALINPNKVKPDYDDKILSIPYESYYSVGTIFDWVGTRTKWLIYLQDTTELAYFRGNIRKCSYQISWRTDDDNICTTWAATRGPVETKINFIQKNSVSVDIPNHSLHILMPRNKDTLEYFLRYSKFYLTGEDEGSTLHCWRVEGVDWISTPGILEVTAVEYYVNPDEDDLENNIAGNLIVKQENPNPEEVEALIEGESIILPNITYKYTYHGVVPALGVWSVSEGAPVKIYKNQEDNSCISLKWNCNFSGKFTLSFDNCIKEIVVKPMFG